VSEFLSATLLHRRGPIEIRDVRCRAHRSGPGGEEHSPSLSLVLPRRGVFVKHGAAGEVTADPLRVVPFVPGDVYRVSHPAGAGDDCTVFEYGDTVVTEAGRTAGWSRDPVRVLRALPAFESPPALFHLMQRLRSALGRGDVDALATEEAALRLLAFAFGRAAPARSRRASAPATRSRHARLVERARQAMAAHFAERLGLLDLARYLEVSPFHLTRVFRAATGRPVHRHMTRIRLSAALEQVTAGASDLTTVALECGFASHSHLTNAFRREYGVPPSRLRLPLARAELLRLSKNLQAGG
jgi:AraC-like DNA-binding protein